MCQPCISCNISDEDIWCLRFERESSVNDNYLQSKEATKPDLAYVTLGRLQLRNQRDADMLVGQLIRGVHSSVTTRAKRRFICDAHHRRFVFLTDIALNSHRGRLKTTSLTVLNDKFSRCRESSCATVPMKKRRSEYTSLTHSFTSSQYETRATRAKKMNN